MTEKELQTAVLALCRTKRLLTYHTFDSRRSQPGFPDLVIVGGNGVLYRELKTAIGQLSSHQKYWQEALAHSGQDVGVWRPNDWPVRITRELRALSPVLTPPLSQDEVRKRLAARGQK